MIALFCGDDNRRAELRFMLDVRGFLVVGVEDAAIADCSLVVADRVAAPSVAYTLRDAERPLLVLAARGEQKYYPLGVQFIDAKSETAELLERIKWAVRRKRGPKKRSQAVASAGNQVCQLA